MKRWAACFAASASLAAFGALGRAHAESAGADCASASASTRLEAYGYTHVVTLSNRCQKPVVCEVWTNVDPLPHLKLQAKAGESVETVTRRGSPSRDVQAGKSCRYAG